MKKELPFILSAIYRHPQFLGMINRIAWREFTSLIDYNHKEGKSFPPASVTFKVSGKCNLNCKMCIYRHTGFLEDGRLLSFEIFKKVIDQVYQTKPFISLTGGEPLLNPSIADFLNYAKERRLTCSMVTNGWNLAQWSEKIIASGVDALVVSIDGPEEVHDWIRGQSGAYRRAFEGIKEILSHAKRPLVFVNAAIQARNYTHLNQLAHEVRQVGVDGMNIQVLWNRPPERVNWHNQSFPEYPVREGWSDPSLYKIDFNRLETEWGRLKENPLMVNLYPSFSMRQVQTWYTDAEQMLYQRRARCPWMMAVIFQDGTLRACDHFVMGNLRNENFWEIWNGEKMVNFRKSLRKSKNLPICAGCCNLFM
jgi:MoaA/NifB/PqqE/SkfB family radical SAM enzyme